MAYERIAEGDFQECVGTVLGYPLSDPPLPLVEDDELQLFPIDYQLTEWLLKNAIITVCRYSQIERTVRFDFRNGLLGIASRKVLQVIQVFKSTTRLLVLF
jgi:hypothetical protein